jgi:SAM-dependent methyltransferase
MTATSAHGGYSGLAAALYDGLRGEAPMANELAFYRRRLARNAPPALEVGCGTGRILLKLLAAGIEAEGLDCSPDMLRICRAKADALGVAPELHEQSIQRMDLPRRYGTIFLPLATFMLLTDRREVRQALETFFRHLQPRGELLFSTYRPPVDGCGSGDWSLRSILPDPAGRGVVRVWVASEIDRERQIATDHHRFELIGGGGVADDAIHSIRLRWYAVEEMVTLLRGCGFCDIDVFGDHAERSAGEHDRVLAFVARRPDV